METDEVEVNTVVVNPTMRISRLILLVMALGPLRAAAQPVIGVVVEEGTDAPLSGAMVILFDSTGSQVAQVLSNAAGRFLVRAHAPGRHYITVERIGYANWTTASFEPDAVGLFTIRVPVEAIPLAGLDVSGGRRCEVRPEEGRATARVWEEVRKALAAEEYTREASLYQYTLFRYDRTLDRDGRNIIEADTMIKENLASAFRTFPIEHLADSGFVQAASGSSLLYYYAPDAGAFLSDAFLDTHCFGLREGEDGRIGLTFRPLEDRDVPEIGGVLWVDAATSELERLEFDYHNLVPSREVGEPGGEVAFTRLPDGAWIVREWRIRMPYLEPMRDGSIRRTAYREESGVTWAITDSWGRTILHAESASISGVVTDSVGAGPPPESVVVEIDGASQQAFTEDDGSFLLSGLVEGRHVLRVQRPLLASWGIASPGEVVAEGRLGEVSHVRLRAPSVADALDASCGGAPRPGGTVAFLGRVSTVEGAPMAQMRVVVRWPQASGYSAEGIAAPLGSERTDERSWTTARDGDYATATTTTDGRGLFLLCDVPEGLRLRVSVTGPAGGDPALTETYLVPRGEPAVVESLIIAP